MSKKLTAKTRLLACSVIIAVIFIFWHIPSVSVKPNTSTLGKRCVVEILTNLQCDDPDGVGAKVRFEDQNPFL